MRWHVRGPVEMAPDVIPARNLGMIGFGSGGGTILIHLYTVRASGTGPICASAPRWLAGIQVALEEWMDRAPPFAIAEGDRAVTLAQGVFDVARLPVGWVR